MTGTRRDFLTLLFSRQTVQTAGGAALKVTGLEDVLPVRTGERPSADASGKALAGGALNKKGRGGLIDQITDALSRAGAGPAPGASGALPVRVDGAAKVDEQR